jgi:predicted peroxiredoxin
MASKYLLIESRDLFDAGDAAGFLDLATGLAKDGNDVLFFLVQNGVLSARRSPRADVLTQAAAAGVKILADEFSLRARGIEAGRLTTGVAPAALDVVLDGLEDGRKTIWH